LFIANRSLRSRLTTDFPQFIQALIITRQKSRPDIRTGSQASFVDRSKKSADPAEMPIEHPNKFGS
jgi:hypothetical protein